MSPPGAVATINAAGFPRVSGDEPTVDRNVNTLAKFSPRERG